MTEHAYILQVPVAKNHHVTIVSNKPMEARHFDMLDRYLALQRQMLCEDDAEEADATPPPKDIQG